MADGRSAWRGAAYRVWQFGRYLFAAGLKPEEREEVRVRLGPALSELFGRMSPGEQAHAYRVMSALVTQGETDRDLLAAALLHDVGKTLAPLNAFERTAAVLARKLAPALAERWGRGEPRGWRRGFVVAAQHPEWGAKMTEKAGATRRVLFILRHQSPVSSSPQSAESRLLAALKRVDEEN